MGLKPTPNKGRRVLELRSKCNNIWEFVGLRGYEAVPDPTRRVA